MQEQPSSSRRDSNSSSSSDFSGEEGEIQSGEETESEPEQPEQIEVEQQVVADADLLDFFETFSQRGKSLLTRDGFEYKFNELLKKSGKETWKCNNAAKTDTYCSGRIRVNREWLQNEQGKRYKKGYFVCEVHVCQPKFFKASKREGQEKLRKEARTSFPGTTEEVVEAARAAMSFEARTKLSKRAMAKLYNDHKLKVADLLVLF